MPKINMVLCKVLVCSLVFLFAFAGKIAPPTIRTFISYSRFGLMGKAMVSLARIGTLSFIFH